MQAIKLTQLQKDILNYFGKTDFGKNFYWTGGTLLAYHYLQNRQSVDIDYFSENLFLDDEYLIFINKMKKDLSIDKIIFNLQMNRRMYLISRKSENVKLELVYFPFPAIEKRQILKEFNINIDSLNDLMANKILATYQRFEPKDVFDLYSYLNKKPKYNIEQLINLSSKKFGVEIEILNLFAKINKLSEQLSTLEPLFIKKEKNLKEKSKKFFQLIFNDFVSKKLI